MTAITQILSDPPLAPDSSKDDEPTFAAKAFTFTQWLAAFGAQLKNWQTQANSLAADISGMAGIALKYTFDATSTADTDPGLGKLRLNNVVQNATTTLRLDLSDANSVSAGPIIDLFDDSTNTVKGLLSVRHGSDLTKYLIFEVTAVATPTGYKNVTVNCVAYSGTSPFANNDPLILFFVRCGDAGTGSGGGQTAQQTQNQTATYVQTAGTSTAYTVTPSPAITAYAPGQSFFVKFAAASGDNPTLQISGLTAPPSLVKQLQDGSYINIRAGDIPNGHSSRVTLLTLSTAWVETLPQQDTSELPALTDGATVNWNLASGQAAQLTLSTTQTARTMNNPTNMGRGKVHHLLILQGSAGGQTISTWASSYRMIGDITLNSGANAATPFTFMSDGTTMFGWRESVVTSAPAPAPTPAPTPVPAPPPSASDAPNITSMSRHPVDLLRIGNYFVDDGRWGFASRDTSVEPSLTEGPASYQYQQFIERWLGVNTDGSISWRMQLRWPQYNSLGHAIDGNPYYNEIKTFPSAMTGYKPGLYGPDVWPAYSFAVRDGDGANAAVPTALFPPQPIVDDWSVPGGSVIAVSPSGSTPGSSIMPMQCPLTGKTARLRGKYVHNSTPTGKGHLSYDIWLTATSTQVKGLPQSPITHEIMIPITTWGGYGTYPNRNPSWYDHDVTIDGVLYHVYCTKDQPINDVTGVTDNGGSGPSGYYPGLHYNFAGLNGGFTNEETGQPRVGWKLIVFEPDGDHHPLDANGYWNIDFTKFIAHLATCHDSRGVAFIQNTEYLPSIEIGVEMIWGLVDLTVYNYLAQLANTVVAAPPIPTGIAPAPSPAPTPSPPSPPPPAPPPSSGAWETLLQTQFTAGNGGYWFDARTLDQFWNSSTDHTHPVAFSGTAGVCINHGNTSNGHDFIEPSNTQYPNLGTDANGKHYYNIYVGEPVSGAGGSSTAFYGFIVFDDTSYGSTLLSDYNAAAHTGHRVRYDGNGPDTFYLDVGTSTGTVTISLAAGFTTGTFRSPGNGTHEVHALEYWYDGTNIGLRLDKSATKVVTQALGAAMLAGTSSLMFSSDIPQGTSSTGANYYQAAELKNYCPNSTDRDTIITGAATTGNLTL